MRTRDSAWEPSVMGSVHANAIEATTHCAGEQFAAVHGESRARFPLSHAWCIAVVSIMETSDPLGFCIKI